MNTKNFSFFSLFTTIPCLIASTLYIYNVYGWFCNWNFDKKSILFRILIVFHGVSITTTVFLIMVFLLKFCNWMDDPKGETAIKEKSNINITRYLPSNNKLILIIFAIIALVELFRLGMTK